MCLRKFGSGSPSTEWCQPPQFNPISPGIDRGWLSRQPHPGERGGVLQRELSSSADRSQCCGRGSAGGGAIRPGLDDRHTSPGGPCVGHSRVRPFGILEMATLARGPDNGAGRRVGLHRSLGGPRRQPSQLTGPTPPHTLPAPEGVGRPVWFPTWKRSSRGDGVE